jgi:glucan 1,6-alpha-glucosidase
MKGTPYIYQGEELGMTNYPFTSFDELDDIEELNMIEERRAKGFSDEALMKAIRQVGRDNARTPMQWDLTANAGFTTANPWLAVNPNYTEINVASNLDDKNSVFYTYQKLIALRKTQDWIINGDFELLESVENVFAYLRKFDSKQYLIVVNLSDVDEFFESPYEKKTELISNDSFPENLTNVKLKPWTAFAVEVK